MDTAIVPLKRAPLFGRLLAATMIAVAAAAVYLGTLNNGFVWDDHILIEQNPFVQDWSNIRQLFSAEFYTHPPAVKAMNQARPVWILASLVDHRLWGLNAEGWHLTNVLLHVLNSFLVFMLAGMLSKSIRHSRANGNPGWIPASARMTTEANSGGSLSFSFLAGLLFSVHPVHVEAVAAVSFRADLLCAFFVLASIILYALAFSSRGIFSSPLPIEAPPIHTFPRRGGREALGRAIFSLILLIFSLAAYALGLLSKEMAIMLPLMLVVLDLAIRSQGNGSFSIPRRAPIYACYMAAWPAYIVFHSVRFSYHDSARWLSDCVSRVVSLLTFAGNVAAQELVRVTASPTRGIGEMVAYDPIWNFSTMAAVLGGYVAKMVLPINLNADPTVSLHAYPWQPAVIFSLAAIGALGIFAYRIRRVEPFVWIGVSAFFIFLIPVLNVVPIHNLMAERYLYLPSIGGCLAMAWGLLRLGELLVNGLLNVHRIPVAARFIGRFGTLVPRHSVLARPINWAATLPAGIVVMAFSFLTIRQIEVWRSDRALWETTARRSPDSARAAYNMGQLSQMEGDIGSAIRHYRRALVLRPDHVEARTNLAVALLTLEKTDSALANYRSLTTRKADSFVPYLNMANILLNQRKWEEAIEAYRLIEERFPNSADYPRDSLNLGLAKAYAMLGRDEESRNHIDKVAPGKAFYDMHAEIARAMEGMNRPGEAEKHYRRILVDVEDAKVLLSLGTLCHHQGRFSEAIGLLRRAIHRRPGDPFAHYNLGTVYSDLSELNSAELALSEAVRLKPDFEDAWYNLAVVNQRQGRLPEAMKGYGKVIEISPSRVEALSNLGGCHELLGDLEEAERYARRAISADPGRSAPHVNLGNIFKRRGRFEQAIASYQQAVRLDPRDVIAYNNLGACYLVLRQPEKAAEEFSAAIRANPAFADSHYHLGLAQMEAGRLDAALESWRKTLNLNPNHPGALRALSALKGK